MTIKDDLSRRFEDELVGQFESDLSDIEAEFRPLTPVEADGMFAALTAMAVGSYNLAGAALEVARGGGQRFPALTEAPDEVTVCGLRQAFDELKDTRRVEEAMPPTQGKEESARGAAH